MEEREKEKERLNEYILCRRADLHMSILICAASTEMPNVSKNWLRGSGEGIGGARERGRERVDFD